MPLALRSRFIVGVYDPKQFDHWPYSHPQEGLFLSDAKRIRLYDKAAEFETIQAAREFYASWKRASRFRCHLHEYKIRVEVPAYVFPDDHPNAILFRISSNESPHVRLTAFRWFLGKSDFIYSKSTIEKHRKVLLLYGIDIYLTPQRLLEDSPSLDDDTWYLSQPKFSMA